MDLIATTPVFPSQEMGAGPGRAADLARGFSALARAAVFYTLPDTTLRALARRLRPIPLRRGDIALEAGERANWLYVVESGRLQVACATGPQPRVAIGELVPGDFFGESGLWGEPSPTSVVSLQESQLMAIERACLLALLSPTSEQGRQLAHIHGQRLRRALTFVNRNRDGESSGALVGIYSPKGGTGRTTIAVNLAAALGRRHPGEVVLLDLSLPYNHAALIANLVPTGCLARTARVPDQAFDDVLGAAVLDHPDGFSVLPGVIRPEETELVDQRSVAAAIRSLRHGYRYVIVDLPTAMSDLALTVLDQAQRVVMIATPELPTLRSGREAMYILEKLGVPSARINLILNQRCGTTSVSRAAVERILSHRVEVEIGYAGGQADQAVMKGRILSLSSRRSRLSRGVERLADLIEPVSANEDSQDSPLAVVRP